MPNEDGAVVIVLKIPVGMCLLCRCRRGNRARRTRQLLVPLRWELEQQRSDREPHGPPLAAVDAPQPAGAWSLSSGAR